MTTEATPQKAVAVKKLDTWQNFQIELRERANEIGAQLPSNVSRDRFISVTLAAVKQTPAILMATPRSLFAAIAKAAQDGLMPDGREGVITVYNQKVPNTSPQQYENVAQWNPMAYGLRKRARELDGIIIDAQVVFDGDEFSYELGDDPRINHKPKPRSEAVDASAGIAVYAIFRHPQEGILHREVMWKPEVFATMNQSKAKTSLMWTTFWTEGWRKAVVRRGMKSVPVSAKLEQVIARVDDDFEFDPVPPKQISRPTPPTPPAEEDENQDASNEAANATETASDATETAETATEGMTLAEADVARQAELHNSDQPAGGENEVAEPEGEQHLEEGEAPDEGPAQVEVKVAPNFDGATPPAPPPEEEASDPIGEFLEHLDTTLSAAGNIETLQQFWNELEPGKELADDVDGLNQADKIYADHEARVRRIAAVAAGQGDLLGGNNG